MYFVTDWHDKCSAPTRPEPSVACELNIVSSRRQRLYMQQSMNLIWARHVFQPQIMLYCPSTGSCLVSGRHAPTRVKGPHHVRAQLNEPRSESAQLFTGIRPTISVNHVSSAVSGLRVFPRHKPIKLFINTNLLTTTLLVAAVFKHVRFLALKH